MSFLNPKQDISVIISVYNGESYICQAIESILNQNFPKSKYSLFIIDDGSLDSTPAILKSYKGIDNLYIIKNKKNKGLGFSLNKALTLVNSKFVIRLDSDDIAFPNLLSELYKNINGYAFCHPYMFIFSDDNPKNKLLYKVSILPSFFASGVLFRYDVLFKYKYSGLFWEEFDLYLKILRRKYKFRIIPKPLLYHRVHSKNFTSDKKRFIEGYYQLQKKWGKAILNQYNFTLDKLLKFYGYYFSESPK